MTTTLIEGGTLIDVATGTSALGDVLIRDGVVVGLGAVDATAVDTRFDAGGMYVSPGWIDGHSRGWSGNRTREQNLRADQFGVDQGVVAIVEAGSMGAPTADEFPAGMIEGASTKVFGAINIGSSGAPGLEGGHSSRWEYVSLEQTVAAVELHRDWMRGIKVQASSSHTGLLGLEAVKIARKAAELTGLPLMAHIGNAPPLLEDVLALLRRGDIVTHTYHGKVGGILERDGTPIRAFLEAVERGVIVATSHGRASYSFAVAERAVKELGLPLDIISTDMHPGNIEHYSRSIAHNLTKALMLGLSIEQVVQAVTINPARAWRLDADGLGSLAVGRPAHVTVFRVNDEPLEVTDTLDEVRTAPRWVEPVAAWVDGRRFDRTAPI
ncbi:MAG: amidohydrolase family protein [Chloroflexi bacterium]|nr:amidohydrolase family protein [Chloroflexota bacterium]MDA1146320.1 amidohydrolase family protein [Chloroflexota bacterium]